MYDGYQRAVASMANKLFDMKTGSGAIATSKVDVKVNEVLAQELNKAMIKKFKRRKVYGRWKFKDNIWATDLIEMWSLSFKNLGDKCPLYVIDAFTKDAWVKPLTDKKFKTVRNGFVAIVKESKHKPNKLWVDQGRGFYNNLTQKWLDNNVSMYLTYIEGNMWLLRSL